MRSEFKGEHHGKLNDRDLVEAVVCLANGSGGVLLVGIEDDGTISGARARHEAGRTDPLRVQALVANTTQPPVSVIVETVDIDGREVLVIEVPDSPRVVGTTRGTYVRRAIAGDGRPTCVPYHAHEMLAHEVERGATDWAALRVGGARWEDLDPIEFERLRRLSATAGDGADRLLGSLSDREIASALGLLRHDAEISTGALLLFGRTEALRRFLPTHEAAFQVLRGLDIEVNDFLPYPLLRLAEEMFARFQARNREEEIQFGLLRVAVSTYSETAFREALANALIHRDYTRRGAVHVQWTDEQLEISSPGGFPSEFGWTTCSLPRRIHAVPCLPMPSNGQAWWSGPGVGSTACSPNSSGSAARRQTTGEAPTTMSSPCSLAGRPTSPSRGGCSTRRRSAVRHSACPNSRSSPSSIGSAVLPQRSWPVCSSGPTARPVRC